MSARWRGSRDGETRVMAVSAAAIYGGAVVLNFAQVLLPTGDEVSVYPGLGALVITLLLLLLGPRLSRGQLFVAGPAGAAFIGVAIATTHTYADAAVLYMWPALWVAFFFGVRGTVFIVVWVAAVHAVALLALPDGQASFARWMDVAAAIIVVAGVVRWLAGLNRTLLVRLEEEARVDTLTGLLNRRGFDERFAIEAARAGRHAVPLAAVAVDIDHFKRVNDEHGHEMGDRILRWLGCQIGNEVRAIDVAARTGGEEFVVLLPDTTLADATTFAERLRAVVAGGSREGCPEHGVASITLTVSAGVAVASDAVDAQTLLARADQALYAAKAAGRNRVRADDDYVATV